MDWAVKIAILVVKYQHPDIIVSGRVREDEYEVKFRSREGGMEVLVDIASNLNLRLYPKFGQLKCGLDVDHYIEILMLARNFMKTVEEYG